MPKLHRYVSQSDKTGYYVKTVVHNNHVTLQVTGEARKLLEELGFQKEDEVPSNLIWTLYNVGLLYTEYQGVEEKNEFPDLNNLRTAISLNTSQRETLLKYVKNKAENSAKFEKLRKALERKDLSKKETSSTNSQEDRSLEDGKSRFDGKDEYAKVLDFLKECHSNDEDERVAQVIGVENFTLLEVVARESIDTVTQGEIVYIGDDTREKIRFIKRKIKLEDLTDEAKRELGPILDELVEEHEDVFIRAINNASPISWKKHQLNLLPRIKPDMVSKLLEERGKEKFYSFEDIKDRTGIRVKGVCKEEVKKELKGSHYIFLS